MKLHQTVILLAVASVTIALVEGLRQDDEEICFKPETFNQTLDLERYAGRWFVYAQIPIWFSPPGCTCGTANYVVNEEGGVDVKNAQVLPNGNYNEICGDAYVPDPEHPGELIVQLAVFPDGNYWLLDTDYSTFAAVYSCAEGEPVRDSPSTVGWVITREAIPSQSAVSAGLDAFVRQGLPVDLLRPVPQEGDVPSCQYEPEEGEYGLGCRPKEGQ